MVCGWKFQRDSTILDGWLKGTAGDGTGRDAYVYLFAYLCGIVVLRLPYLCAFFALVDVDVEESK